MAIAVIKQDGRGNLYRDKYQIVELGNFDPHEWSRTDFYAPVMTQLELRFTIGLAVKKHCIHKTGDIIQAFCQSHLPEGENYTCSLLPGCPVTKSGTLLKLKHSPRNFKITWLNICS